MPHSIEVEYFDSREVILVRIAHTEEVTRYAESHSVAIEEGRDLHDGSRSSRINEKG